MEKTWRASLLLPLALGLLGCSGTVRVSGQFRSTVPVIVTLQDTPPTGVTVLSFVLQITGMSLTSATPGIPSATLLEKPISVQVQHLQTLNEFLTRALVPAATFTSLVMTFGPTANMTIVNGSLLPVTVGGQTCAVGQVCQLQPKLNVSSLTLASGPFPLVLADSIPVSISLNFNLQSSIQGDFSISPVFTLTASTAAAPNGSLVEVGGMNGVISSIGNNQFTVLDASTGNFVPMTVNTGITAFNNFFTCQQGNFTCLQTGQNANIPFGIAQNTPQIFSASSVNFVAVFTQGFDGIITSLSPATNQFTMVVTGISPVVNGTNISGITAGEPVVVFPVSTAVFRIANGPTSVPANFTFQGFSGLAVGQHIFLNAASIGSGFPVTLTADQIVLSTAQFSGSIRAIASPNLTIGQLNALFTGAGISQMFVQTSSQTQFANLSNGFNSIGLSNTLSFGGLLFNTPAGPMLIAQQVAAPPSTPIVESSVAR